MHRGTSDGSGTNSSARADVAGNEVAGEMARRNRSAVLGILLVVAMLCLALGCRDPLDLPVPDPQPERPFP